MKMLSTVTLLLGFLYQSHCGQAQQQPRQQDSIYTYKTPGADGTGKFYLEREIAPVMGASGASWLERDGRQKEENTDLAIKKIALQPGDVVADIGAGTGYYAFRLARKVPQGKVYAVDVQDEMIQYLNANKQQQHITNVEVVKGSDTSPNLPANNVDLAIMVDVYHELEYPHEMLQSLRQALKQNGRILLLEYRREDPSIPIKPLHKTTVAQVSKEMEASGFKLAYRGEFLPIQHFLIYEKVAAVK